MRRRRATFGLRHLLGLGLGLLVATPACSTLVDEEEGEVPITEIPKERQGTIKVHKGYVDGKAVEFYRMGTFVPGDSSWFPSYEKFPGMVVSPIYVWIDESGFPSLATAQLPIIDTLPQQAHYSDFFEVVAVSLGGDFAANDIKSRGTLLRAEPELVTTGWVVNCPVVGPEGKLEQMPGKAYRKLKVWYRKQITYCMLMDGAEPLTGKGGAPKFKTSSIPLTDSQSELSVTASEHFTMISTAFAGADQQTGIPVPNNDVFVYRPGDSKYTPLTKVWDVTVPSDYKVGQITSRADLFPVPSFTDPRIKERTPEAFCNCPILPN